MYEELLTGVVDLHIHAGPSVANREVDVAEMLRLAERAHYRAFVVKDHYFPTMLSAAIAEKHVGTGSVKVFGGIVLNNSLGKFSLKAVDAAWQMGAKFVCMPTLSAKRHIDTHQGKAFAGASAKASGVAEDPIYYLDAQGGLIPEVRELLAYLATKPELILYTGHGSAEEVDVLVHKAVEAGVSKILINHPFMTVDASLEQIVEWSRIGAHIEFNASAFPRFIPTSVIGPILENVSVDKLVIDTDSGQKGGGSPVAVLCRLITIMKEEFHVSDDMLMKMMQTNPAGLLGL